VLRIRDIYPGSRILILTHPGSRIQKQQQKRGVKKICYHTFFCSCKLQKIEYYFIFEMLKKKIWANFQRIIEVFTQKFFTKLSKIWIWDPGSGKKLFRIPDPGVKKALDPGSGSATLSAQMVVRRPAGRQARGSNLAPTPQGGFCFLSDSNEEF
jgi:hypothetical protein